MKNVFEWVNDPSHSYDEGLDLLKSLKPREYPFFSSVKNPPRTGYHFRMLETTLLNCARILSQTPETIPPKPIIIQPVPKFPPGGPKPDLKGPVFVSNPIIDVKELPKDLQDLYFETKKITREIAQDHAKMKATKSAKIRKESLENITALERTKKEYWETLDNFWKTHMIKTDSKEQLIDAASIAADAIAVVNRVRTLKINISRAKKELPELTGKKKESRIQKIKLWETELKSLEKK